MNRAGAGGAGGKPAPGPGYGTGARIFHWLVALLVVVQIPAGIAMTSEPLLGVADPLYILHKGSGSVLLVLVLARIAWRLTHRPPPFEEWMRPGEKRTAAAAHAAIYVLLLLMTVSGYVRTVGDGFPIEFLDALGVPPLIPFMPRAARVMLVVHQFAVVALIILVSAHVSQVLRHQLIERNPVLARMWPPFGGRRRARAAAPGAGEDA
ncbi:MAG: cytochrome b/b6 domain-containing protein [Gammaproteobacteria bacterium]|nr:cytochrome b/b6 domain-containing protein [Gammaproteobacteria bacterium]MDE0249017.1 cytochrome b/b6 domain-containing protein [Gammaproteobacteria bacterium]